MCRGSLQSSENASMEPTVGPTNERSDGTPHIYANPKAPLDHFPSRFALSMRPFSLRKLDLARHHLTV